MELANHGWLRKKDRSQKGASTLRRAQRKTNRSDVAAMAGNVPRSTLTAYDGRSQSLARQSSCTCQPDSSVASHGHAVLAERSLEFLNRERIGSLEHFKLSRVQTCRKLYVASIPFSILHMRSRVVSSHNGRQLSFSFSFSFSFSVLHVLFGHRCREH
jgi:hypothetical protein